MFEKVNPSHPDKVADRIAGAIVDMAYRKEDAPKVAVEVLLGHGECNILVESNVDFNYADILNIVKRITRQNDIKLNYKRVPQDVYLAGNQNEKIKCGDNGIFKGTPVTTEQQTLTNIVSKIYNDYPYDGKYIINENRIIACQSNIKNDDLKKLLKHNSTVNPLGEWTGGIDVDSGATNRKLGSDMGDSVTGGGLHGKDLSKADVSVNIYCFLKAQDLLSEYKVCCAIGDDEVDDMPYEKIVAIARKYVDDIGGFEKFAEWGLIRPE